jgi:hypothetical protein
MEQVPMDKAHNQGGEPAPAVQIIRKRIIQVSVPVWEAAEVVAPVAEAEEAGAADGAVAAWGPASVGAGIHRRRPHLGPQRAQAKCRIVKRSNGSVRW